MPTDDTRAEAIEAAKRELRPYFDVAYRDRLAPAAATRAVDAAIPYLLAPIRALADEWEADGPHCAFWGAHTRLRMVLDAIKTPR